MNPLTINDLNQAIVRHCRENNQSWLGRWEDRPWLTLELGQQETRELDNIACETTYTKSGIEAIKAGLRKTIHDGRSWCEFSRIKIKTVEAENHFALV